MAPRFLSIADVAEQISISAQAVRSLIRTVELPAIKVGARGLWRIEVAALEDYIDKQYAHTREAVSEGGLDL